MCTFWGGGGRAVKPDCIRSQNSTGAPIRETGQFGSTDARMRPGSQRNYRTYEVWHMLTTHTHTHRNTCPSTQGCVKREPVCSGNQWSEMALVDTKDMCFMQLNHLSYAHSPLKGLGPRRESYFPS